jgi:hypothetical protein
MSHMQKATGVSHAPKRGHLSTTALGSWTEPVTTRLTYVDPHHSC